MLWSMNYPLGIESNALSETAASAGCVKQIRGAGLYCCHRDLGWSYVCLKSPTPVFLPGESQGRGSLVGCRLWGRTESDVTEAT